MYIEPPKIAAVVERGQPVPPRLADASVLDTQGTLFPGLIELHNHLSYNALRLWGVPQKFANRAEWQQSPVYAQRVTGPMGVIGRSRDPLVVPSLVRFVETKCLVAGVTTSQGIALSSDADIERYYRGVIRTVEAPDDAALPRAMSQISDVAAADWQRFHDELRTANCFLLHLAEGLDTAARAHFLALQRGDAWAITPALAGIHCAALEAQDFDVMAKFGASVVWSPLSNYLLYGGTTRIEDARAAGLRIALGSDWSPTGSKNLLAELKVARAVAAELGAALGDAELVAMATRNPAAILGWSGQVGSIEEGKRADLLVIRGTAGDPYSALLEADERDVVLVALEGSARYGRPALLESLGAGVGETIAIGGEALALASDGPDSDPEVTRISLSEAKEVLRDVLSKIPTLSADESAGRGALGRSLHPSVTPGVRLALHEQEPHGVDLRPHLPYDGVATGGPTPAALAMSASPTSGAAVTPRPPALPLQPVTLDALTAADDERLGAALQSEANLPTFLKAMFAEEYGTG